MRVSSLLMYCFGSLACPATLAAQWPGELAGRIRDALTGAPLSAVEISVEPGARTTLSDASGNFRLRGLESGTYRVAIRRLGYVSVRRDTEVRSGSVTRLNSALAPLAIPLEGLTVTGAGGGGTLLDRETLLASGAGTAGDALRAVPGIVLQDRGRGAAQYVSIRGSAPDAVLVLLDGIPLNDPITGEADLSTVPAGSLQSARVLPGALSARFGPRASAGVIILETATDVGPWDVSAEGGSLGLHRVRLGVGRQLGRGHANGRAEFSGLDGGFDVVIPPEAGGGQDHRRNADVRTWNLSAAWSGGIAMGDLTAAAGFEKVDRGLPGRSFGPSPNARQDFDRVRSSMRWAGHDASGRSLAARAFMTRQGARFRDTDPPFGFPFDDRTVLWGGGASLEGAVPAFGILRMASLGLEMDLRRVESSALSTELRPSRLDLSLWMSGKWEPAEGDWSVGFSVRGHRAGRGGQFYGTHEISVSAPVGGASLHVAHRSAFSPPTLGDQFFREGVGIEPNPDLRAERVPSEIAAGLSWARRVGGAEANVSVETYRGDVKGMIVWLPDFRFVWSPRNVDIRRIGAEVRAEMRLPGTGLSLAGSYSLTKTTYDRDDSSDVQVAYRPRHGMTVDGRWQRGAWSSGVAARFTGARFPVPSPVNELRGFWVTDVDIGHRRTVARWTVESHLRIERLFDATDALIFAYPDPGRILRLELRVGPRTP